MAGPIDDDYIVHRYAANLLAGHGFVFNPGGEVAEGFTAPLWLLCSVLAQSLGVAPEALTFWCGALSASCLAWIAARTGLRLARGGRASASVAGDAPMDGPRRGPFAALCAAWPGLAVALSPAVAFHAVAGLGTVPLALLLTLFASAWWRADEAASSPIAAGLWLGLACLMRQECALLWLPFAVVLARRGQYGPLVPALVALLGWSALRWAVFGRLDPITHAVKRLPLVADLEYGLAYLHRATSEGLVGLLLALSVGVALSPRARPVVRAVALGVILHGVFVVFVGGDWMPLARFYVPTLPLALLLAAYALHSAASAGGARATHRRSVGSQAVVCGIGALIAAGGLALGGAQRGAVLFDWSFFERRWLELGDYFRERADPSARVALSPIGAFGLRSRLPIVDLLGLTHSALLDVEPDLAGVKMKGHHRHDPDWVLRDPPEYVLLGNGVVQPDTGRLAVNPWERQLVLDPRFAAAYVQVRVTVAGEVAEWFRRRDVAPFPGEALVRLR
ncbi:MAG: hypothetical protein R3F49_04425 [Planctomycetota bacterium]